jgi:hypothetical protein
MSMPWNAVHEVGYDPICSTLRLTFSTGAIYEFQDVPVEKYAALVQTNPQARGDYFELQIMRIYQFKRVV